MHLHEIGKHVDHILASDATGCVDGQTLSLILIDDGNGLTGPAIVISIKDKSLGPEVALVLRPQSDTR